MKTVQQVISQIETFAPPQLAKFDYVGLLHGDHTQQVKKVGLTLDYSLQNIQKAIDAHCDLLITHHGPLDIHYPVVGNNLEKIVLASAHSLSVYRCHLNLDFCRGGIIEELSNLLQIPTESQVTQYENYKIKGGVRLAENFPLTLTELMERVKVINSSSIRIAGAKKQKFRRIALTSGKGFISEFFDQLRPEVYIAGEFEQEATKYAEDMNIMLVELSHHASEVEPLKRISPKLSKLFGIEVIDIETPDTIRVRKNI